ncbi:hypothetical protein AN958_03278 [Leucoagaricus sp. SymC.cos]|nr:hypothetical protein AN958_03278 [Leucoagaricus sp. SymC.cos]
MSPILTSRVSTSSGSEASLQHVFLHQLVEETKSWSTLSLLMRWNNNFTISAIGRRRASTLMHSLNPSVPHDRPLGA